MTSQFFAQHGFRIVCRSHRLYVWKQSFYDAQLVGITVEVAVKNSKVIQFIHPHLPAGVDDMAFGQDNPDVGDVALSIVKKREIARLAFFHKINRPALCDLLIGITKQANASRFVHHLG